MVRDFARRVKWVGDKDKGRSVTALFAVVGVLSLTCDDALLISLLGAIKYV